MSPIKLDFTGVADGGFEPLPAGVYPAQVEAVEQKTGQESGQPYLAVTFRLTDSKRKAWSNFSLQAQSLWKLKQMLVRLGWSAESLAGAFDLDPRELIGKRCMLQLGMREYQGRQDNEVLDVLAVEGGAGGKATSSKGRSGRPF